MKILLQIILKNSAITTKFNIAVANWSLEILNCVKFNRTLISFNKKINELKKSEKLMIIQNAEKSYHTIRSCISKHIHNFWANDYDTRAEMSIILVIKNLIIEFDSDCQF